MDSTKRKSNPCPRNTANPISLLFFWWLMDIFKAGTKRDLEVSDLYDTMKGDFSAELGDVFELNWRKQLTKAKNKSNSKPSLKRAIFKTFYPPYVKLGIMLAFQQLVIRIAIPVSLGYLLTYFNPESEVTKNEAFIYAGILLSCTMVNIFLMHHSGLLASVIGMRVRIACCSLIYRKVLCLSKASAGQTGAGQMVNLLSNDVNRFDNLPANLHYIWITPIQTVIATYFIWRSVGWASIAGVVGIFLQTVPVQNYISRLTSKYRLKIATRTDNRVRIMTEIISGMQVIKMYAWEMPFEKVVHMARRQEVKVLKWASYLRGVQAAFGVFTERTSLYITVVAFALLGNTVTADKVFSLAQFFNIIQFSMAISYPMAVQQSAEAKVSIQRIENFLLQEEHIQKPLNCSAKREEKLGVSLKNASARWVSSSISETLSNISLLVKPGKLCAIIGPVGSGKSSLLQAVLGELPLSTGSISVEGDISYASQDPWLFVGSVRQNILFGQEYEPKRYHEVIRACALTRDFELFPHGDKTIVGERGVSLSGGQRARINLARAVYRKSELYLLDDPLSAVDTHVGKQLFEDCISTYLANKTRILVTHQLQYLKDADLIVILSNGKIENQGTFSELIERKTNFSQMLLSNQEDTNTGNIKPTGIEKQFSVASIQSSVPEDEDENEEPDENTEMIAKGKLRNSLYKDYFTAGSSYSFLAVVVFFLILGQIASSGSDYWVTYWTNQEQIRIKLLDDFQMRQASHNSSHEIYNETVSRNVSFDAFHETKGNVSNIFTQLQFTENISDFDKSSMNNSSNNNKDTVMETASVESEITSEIITKNSSSLRNSDILSTNKSTRNDEKIALPNIPVKESTESSTSKGTIFNFANIPRTASLKEILESGTKESHQLANRTKITLTQITDEIGGMLANLTKKSGVSVLFPNNMLENDKYTEKVNNSESIITSDLLETQNLTRQSEEGLKDTMPSSSISDFVEETAYPTESSIVTLQSNTETSAAYNSSVKRRKREVVTFYNESMFYTRDEYILIYTMCIIACIIITIIRAFLFFKVALNSSQGLHDRMFNSVLKGTMRFFDTNPSGRILNRFSKDMGAVDEQLPSAMLDAVIIFLVMMGILTMVVIANYYFVFAIVIFGYLFYKIRTIYLRTAQGVKRLEGITRSPVFSYLSASLNGLTTIRASKAQAMVTKEFDNLQDLHTSSWYIFCATSSAFSLALDCVSFIFISAVVLSFLILDTQTLGGYVGLAIAQALILTGMLQHGIRQTTVMVNQMTSVERILQYDDIEREPPFESEKGKKPPVAWPDDGAIQFDHMSLRYAESQPPVLKDLNFSIEPAHKVGIVGRTGAGKSSLIAALFRLSKLEGAIYIDDINTQAIGLHDLRKHISIIPQEPVLFSASVRYNLDPFNEFPDNKLWEVLEEVELKEAIENLEFQVTEGGSNFSAGQRQLVCLARAILRNNKILVLDEATANVDPQTDALIQQTIRTKFKDCTVLTIAHRLNTIMDSDRVLVMDAGTMVEFAHPHELMQKTDGHFYKMVQQTGKSMAQQLAHIAEEAYKKSLKEVTSENDEMVETRREN